MTTTIWILGDQLTPDHPALTPDVSRENVVILMVESAACKKRLPYHAKKLALLFSAMRHRAEALRKGGYHVDYRQAEDMTAALRAHCQAYQAERLVVMAASSQRGRKFQTTAAETLGIPVRILPNGQFLSNRFDPLPEVKPGEIVRQERFYRAMRRHFRLLMDAEGEPLGGKWNFDQQNRKPLAQDALPPGILHFQGDTLTQQVISEIRGRRMATSGVLDQFDLAVTHHEAQRAADDFFENRLPQFGTYEDAMSRDHAVLYHSKLSPYLNLGLLDPLELAERAEQAYYEGRIAINNAEGFIRQVIGWREYIFWQYKRLMPDLAAANFFNAQRPIPKYFWNAETEMNCLRVILGRVLRGGYVHHIERLMVISNFCLLAGIHPQAVLDWFQSTFIDAYDWVMVPNVIGMGLYADGGQIGTKPYIASANYINKMGDYCGDCRYSHKQRTGEGACPFNFLYWGFLLEHEARLRGNQRMARMLYNLKYLDEDERSAVRLSVEKIF